MDRRQPNPASVTTNATETGVFKKIGNVLRSPEGKIVEAALVMSIGVSALTGCTPDEAPKPTTTQSQEATPKPEAPSPTPTETQPSTEMPKKYDFGVPYSEIQGFRSLSPEEVGALDEDTKALYARGMAQQFDLAGFANSFYSISGHDADINLPAEVGEDNTPEQAWAFITQLRGLALHIPNNTGNTVDSQSARSVLATTYINGVGAAGYKGLSAFIDEVGGDNRVVGTGRTFAASGAPGTPRINSSSEAYKDESGRTCLDTNITEQGDTENITICLIGKPGQQIWATKESTP